MSVEYSAQNIIDKRYGVKTTERENPLISSVGTTVSQILPGDPRRVAVVIVNLSANTMYLAPNNQVSSSNGIVLGANGGTVSMTIEDDFTLINRAWYVVSTAASSSVYAVEVILR